MLTSMSHRNRRRIHNKGRSPLYTTWTPCTLQVSACVCVAAYDSVCDKPQQHPVYKLIEVCSCLCTHVHARLPCSWDRPPCDKINLKVKCRAGKMSSPLLVNVSWLRTPLPLGSIASSLSASVASSSVSLSHVRACSHACTQHTQSLKTALLYLEFRIFI